MSITAHQPQLDWIASQQAHMAHLLYGWSAINSGSTNVVGLAKMAKVLEDNFFWLNAPIERIKLPPMQVMGDDGMMAEQELGECLRLQKHPHAPIQVALVGHYDTVFDEAHPFQTPRFLDERTLNGPGVADLKGGLIVMLKALEALEQSPYAGNIGWQVLLNPDEEIGSIGSDPILKQVAQLCHIGLIFEPALPDGTLAGARKGSGNFTIHVTGKAAHAGRNPRDGRNAVVAASAIAVALMELNDAQSKIAINPARIIGGGALNVVPDHAILRFNVRTESSDDEAWMLEKIKQITEQFRNRNGYDCQLHGHFTRAPKPMCARNEALFGMVRDTGEMLGHAIAWRDTGGACDGNNLYKYGLPNVDTLGVRGGNIHSDQEFMEIESLTERSQLSALLLLRLASGELKLPDIITRKSQKD